MLNPTVIDNGDTVFHFDFPEESGVAALTHGISRPASPDPASSSSGIAEGERFVECIGPETDSGKGKGVSTPMPIPSGSLLREEDVFSDLQPSSHTGSSPSLSVFVNYPQKVVHSSWGPSSSSCSRSNASSPPESLTGPSEGTVYGKGKGKGKAADLPPCLPPLAFSRPEFSYSHIAWPSSSVTDSVEPSSYGSPRFDSRIRRAPAFHLTLLTSQIRVNLIYHITRLMSAGALCLIVPFVLLPPLALCRCPSSEAKPSLGLQAILQGTSPEIWHPCYR